jgi:hypothetical protein
VVVFVLAGLPALIVFSVMGGRRVSTGRIGVFGWIIGQTSMPVLLFTLFPWISLLFLAMVPVLLNRAVFEEKSLRVSQWQEITHVTVGDSQSWREN